MRRNWESVEEYAKRLEGELSSSRHVVLQMSPKAMHDVFGSYYAIKNREEFHEWERDIVHQTLQLCEDVPEDNMGQRQSPCPLCQEKSSAPYARGFTLDEGLRRHLMGYGNNLQCFIIREITELARQFCEKEMIEKESSEEKARARIIARRRIAERLFLVRPDEESYLVDQSIYSSCRNEEEIEFAEQRLHDLGFTIETIESTTAYRLESDNCYVLADPRAKGTITFLVFKQNPKYKKQSFLTHTFYFQDSWKNNLLQKFNERLIKAKDSIANQR